jgi:hypothetical protein
MGPKCDDCEQPWRYIRAYKIKGNVVLLCPTCARLRGLPVLHVNQYQD